MNIYIFGVLVAWKTPIHAPEIAILERDIALNFLN